MAGLPLKDLTEVTHVDEESVGDGLDVQILPEIPVEIGHNRPDGLISHGLFLDPDAFLHPGDKAQALTQGINETVAALENILESSE